MPRIVQIHNQPPSWESSFLLGASGKGEIACPLCVFGRLEELTLYDFGPLTVRLMRADVEHEEGLFFEVDGSTNRREHTASDVAARDGAYQYLYVPVHTSSIRLPVAFQKSEQPKAYFKP